MKYEGYINKRFLKLSILALAIFAGNFSGVWASREIIKPMKNIEYSINVMWINKELNPEQPFIHPSKDKKKLKKIFLNPILNWAKSNPDSVVNVWFDSKFVTKKAIKKTQVLIKEYSKKKDQIKLRDVREIPKVKKYKEVFSNKTPVYFRVDLLRVIIAVHILCNTKEASYFVYADLDMKAISREEIFDKETMQNLERYGIIMSIPQEGWGFENGFQIISNHNPNLIKSTKYILIKLNIQRAYNALNENFCYDGVQCKTGTNALEQIIYDSYIPMFKYFYFLEEYYNLFADDRLETIYKKEEHGFEPFGLKYVNPRMPIVRLIDKFNHIPCKTFIPTKKVDIPPTKIFGKN